jgi:hypothetical protein
MQSPQSSARKEPQTAYLWSPNGNGSCPAPPASGAEGFRV